MAIAVFDDVRDAFVHRMRERISGALIGGQAERAFLDKAANGAQIGEFSADAQDHNRLDNGDDQVELAHLSVP